ncbi:Protein SSO1 [Cyberlindnera fabianii]|uniref:Protein SSO1 n=1 Tax=Cyberlindnera fabianii TaxID=36022 RepID=A0A1V2L8S1_CYBFA|nr:Protein SSO1 [Cyberlindnera fabianii]
MNQITDINNDLENYKQLVELIEFNQKKLLNEVNEEQEAATRKQLDNLMSQASSMQQTLKTKIKSAQAQAGSDSFSLIHSRYRGLNYKEANRDQLLDNTRLCVQMPLTLKQRSHDDVGGQKTDLLSGYLNSTRRGEARTALADFSKT